MQILHPFTGSVQQYLEQIADPDLFPRRHGRKEQLVARPEERSAENQLH